MKNIIAALIIAFGMIASAIIYLLTPKAGRYVYKHIEEDGRVGPSVFDTGTAIYYQDVTFTKQKYPQRSIGKFSLIDGTYEILREYKPGEFRMEKESIKDLRINHCK